MLRRRLIDASAAFGLRVADIRVEGRATTDRETILDALGARPGTPILAVDPARAKQQLESLPWVRSARSSVGCRIRSMSAWSSASRWRCGSTPARSS